MADFDEVLNELYCYEGVKLSKKEKKMIDALSACGAVSYYDLMEMMDFRPSKFIKHLGILEMIGFVNEEDELLTLTDLAVRYLSLGKKERKQNKKFLDFVESLSDEEVEDLRKSYEDTLEEEPAEAQTEE